MSLQSVSKTILVLETLLKFPDGRTSVSELSRELGWSRAATHQYVSTLAEAGWLVQNTRRDYQLSPRAAVFGRFAIEYAAVPVEVTRTMEALVEDLNEPISYAVLNGNEATIIERHEPKRPFAIIRAAEPHLDLRTSASGMVLLAFDAHIDESRWEGMEDALETVRQQGYAESHSEWLGDIVDVVAVPVMSAGECLGALSVIAPAGRFDIPTARAALLEARQRLEQELGVGSS
ncbi:IclR family transcriptional regulator [Brevibacterium sanguinis]|uniref:IclR family transcriptional regulator n=2 Tax=Brevibacterium TaxID=1696 RepID=A0A366II92_9MICO|nr:MULTISPECIES: helix-turn-helix domain-containing protein [Brevibacterium]RBP63575.1 IclR family transcriptional regulator [Brevibacterium sanguinis]RBP70234.1 IclR family transcriptional regulator [Brevibacterium celere]